MRYFRYSFIQEVKCSKKLYNRINQLIFASFIFNSNMNKLVIFFLFVHSLYSQLLGGQISLSQERADKIISSDPGFQMAFAKVKQTIAALCEIDFGKVKLLSYAMETGPTYEIEIETLIGCIEVVVNVRFWLSQVKIFKIELISSKIVEIPKEKIQKEKFLTNNPNFNPDGLPASILIAGEPKILTINNNKLRQNLIKNQEQKFGNFKSICQFRKKEVLKAISSQFNGQEQSKIQIQNSKQQISFLSIRLDEKNNYISEKKSNSTQAQDLNILNQVSNPQDKKAGNEDQPKNEEKKLLGLNNNFGTLLPKVNY